MIKKKFYVTTPIYYPNDIPHVGHAYTTIAADVLARWNSLLGNEIFFLTGTDEHGKKIADTAKKNGKTPKEFVDSLVPKFKDAWKKLNLNYDYFIRTTDKTHEKIVQEMLSKSYKNKDIYLGTYEGLYCTSCEAYYTEKDLINDCCPIHKKPVESLKEESYFFRLSKYQDKLLDFYKENPDFISPSLRKQEVINRIKEGLKDLSISRTNFDWGVPLPFDKKHVCYVWFDALFNYYSATQQKGKEKFWPTDLHLIGKDILWFHTVYWPAFLMSVGLKLPKKVFAHGWWTFDKEKISKSAGKVINIDELIAITGNADSVRYFLLRATPFGDDGDFSETALINRHNDELADKLGNLVSRVSALIEKYGVQKVAKISLSSKKVFENVKRNLENLEFDKALNEVFSFIDLTNEYVQNKKPWETRDKKVLYELANMIKSITILLWPFIPSTSEKIAKQFGFKIDLKELNKPLNPKIKIKKGEILFKKIEGENIKSPQPTPRPPAPRREVKEDNQSNSISDFIISPELKEDGINVSMAIFKNFHISKSNPKLEKLKEIFIYKLPNIKRNNNILDGYKGFYKSLGLDNVSTGAEGILNYLEKNKKFPVVNTLVDSYNLISAETFISIGAHDISKIKGQILFRKTNGDEKFIPLGERTSFEIRKGEYACMDDEKILCRMEIKQCNETKISDKTKEVVIYAQGNKNVSDKYLRGSLIKACELIKEVCGGEYEIIQEKINKPANIIEGIIKMENIVEFSEWQKLELVVAEIKKIEDIEGADKLYKLILNVGKFGEKIVCAGLKEYYSKKELLGKKIIYFLNLKPRLMKGIESSGMILAAVSDDHKKVSLISPDKSMENGSRVS
jgi:methionyl-tRNA synthetase